MYMQLYLQKVRVLSFKLEILNLKNLKSLTEHQNWLGVDDSLGPVAVSIRREKVEDATDSAHSLPTYQYRIIVRTSEVMKC